jgi:AcrR family transcriptional regulator
MVSDSASSASEGSTRTRLNKDLIVDAAIRQLRKVGAEKFSLRALAKELGVTPMALYRHVPNKQVLLEEVRASMLELVPWVIEPDKAEATKDRPLSEQEIVDQALDLTRRVGLSRLSMRLLARELSVTPMSIYRHVPNKSALLARMTDAVTARLPRPTPTPETWRQAFRQHARSVWQAFTAYPGLVGSFAAGPSASVLEHMAYEHGIFRVAGLDPQAAAHVVTVYHTFMLGLFRTHSYLHFLVDQSGGKTDVNPERIRRYGGSINLSDLLEVALDAVVLAAEARLAEQGCAQPRPEVRGSQRTKKARAKRDRG